jgi:hypothetical protein
MFDDSDLLKVDWNRLGGPYKAARVPELLRTLRDRAAGGRESYEETWGELVNEINHQGTIYEVAAHAIPFLIDLVRGDVTADRVDIIVDLLVWFGEMGQDTLWKEKNPPKDVHGFNPATKQPILIRAINDRPAARKAREALRTGFEVYLRLLVRSDGAVRCAAAYALAHYPELADTHGPPIRAAARVETDPVLRAGLMLSLGYLRDTSADARGLLEKAVQTGNSAEERLTAAVALAHIYGCQASDQAIDLLQKAQAASEYEKPLSMLPWHWHVSQDVEEAFKMAGIEN